MYIVRDIAKKVYCLFLHSRLLCLTPAFPI